jgi:hypothetical protein
LGAPEAREIPSKHTKNDPDRFVREVQPILQAYAGTSVMDIEASTPASVTAVSFSDSPDSEVLENRHEGISELVRRDG